MSITQAPADTDVVVRLDQVSKQYGHGPGALLALDRVSLTVRQGEFVCLLGASGCGKSTLLSLVAGLDEISGGTLDTGGRHVSLMVQEPALFPWLSVSANVELPLRLKGVGTRERRRRAEVVLEVVRLKGFGGKRPHELSGGMRQRVALARALAQDADILLMDEPFGALDALTREQMNAELNRIWRETGTTVVLVTHSIAEAVFLGTRIEVMTARPGRILRTFDVDLPPHREYARVMSDPRFDRLATELRGLLGSGANH